jgi:hypothetical protein
MGSKITGFAENHGLIVLILLELGVIAMFGRRKGGRAEA